MEKEIASQGDNIFLTQRSELLSSLHYSKDLNLDGIRASPTPDTGKYKEISSNAERKHRSRGKSRAHRSRSSPARPALSKTRSPERRACSPSVSEKRLMLSDPPVLPVPTVLSPHDSLYTHQITPGAGPSATSYFSPQPPSMPLYIVPLPPNPSATAAQIEKNTLSQHQSKVKTRNHTVRRIARHLLHSILKKLPINTENVGVEAVEVKIAVTEPELSLPSNRSIATQALTKYGNNRKKLSDEEKELSSSESSEDGCEWAGPVRALRNSHVRLVLRQLRHLRDIERLRKTLRREHAHE